MVAKKKDAILIALRASYLILFNKKCRRDSLILRVLVFKIFDEITCQGVLHYSMCV
jgi:hypothetical protein